MSAQHTPGQVVEALTEIFERADMECYHLRRNQRTQGQWRNVMLLAKQGLRAARAPIPETMQQREEAARRSTGSTT